MIDTSTPVLVLRSANHGGLAIARSLGRLGVSVYLLDANPRTPSFDSGYCRGSFVWDIDHAPAEESVEYLAKIGRRLGRRIILIPTSDTGALFVAANAGALREWFIFPDLCSQLVQSLYSKKEMHFLARSVGVPTPNALFPESKQEALHFAEGATFPIMLKMIDARNANHQAARTKVIARGKHELLANYELMEDPERPNLMLQEYIPGGEEANWMFNGYFNENSACLFGLTGKKIRQNPPHAGITSLGVCLPNAAVAETTRRFMKSIRYRGILDIGYRYDARDGLHKVFDVNPRIGCTFRLFVSNNGTDVARALYLDLTGQLVVPGRDLPGRKWMVEDLDLASAFQYWHDGTLTLTEWWRSLRGLQESAFFAADDRRPMISMCLNDVRKLCRLLRIARGSRSHAAPSSSTGGVAGEDLNTPTSDSQWDSSVPGA
jgi:D-aspartate ligase